MKIKFDCGCTFPVVGNKIVFNTDIEELNLNCQKTWDLICSGDTKGVFQLETGTGQSKASQVKPRSIEELGDLSSIIRPGTSEAFIEGKSLTNHYIDRKAGKEEVTYLHPILKPILESTYGIVVFQEQGMKICVDVAGFTESEADDFRKAAGKKKPEEMAKIEAKFLERAEKLGRVSVDEAKEIFSWLKASQRYSFNKCLSGDTLIETYTGYKRLQDVNIGDYVNSPYGMIKVVNKYDNGPKEIYEAVFSCFRNNVARVEINDNGSHRMVDIRIKCTKDHKFLCTDGVQRTLEELIKVYHQNNYVYIQCNNKFDGVVLSGYIWCDNVNTYDLEVDHPAHVYYANDLAVSNSHAIAYSLTTYVTAYCKTHFPKAFFTSYLALAYTDIDKSQEIKDLVNNARLSYIEPKIPNIDLLNESFSIINGDIYYGITDIKGIGTNHYKKLVELLNKYNYKELGWTKFLVYILSQTASDVAGGLILSGALSKFKLPRTYMKYEYDVLLQLTDKELKYLIENVDDGTLLSNLEKMVENKSVAIHDKNRLVKVTDLIKSLRFPSSPLIDRPEYIGAVEESLLSIPITCSALDANEDLQSNCTCRDFVNGRGDKVVIAAQIDGFRLYKIKTGQNTGKEMCYLSISDSTGNLGSVMMFNEVYEKYKHLIIEQNTVNVVGVRDKKTQKSLVVSKLVQI